MLGWSAHIFCGKLHINTQNLHRLHGDPHQLAALLERVAGRSRESRSHSYLQWPIKRYFPAKSYAGRQGPGFRQRQILKTDFVSFFSTQPIEQQTKAIFGKRNGGEMPCVLPMKKVKFMPNEIPKKLLDLKLADLLDAHFNDDHRGHGTCGRIKNLLRWAYDNPIQTVEDLLKLSKREISRIPNIGKKTVAELEEVLAKLEIRLATREGYTAVYLGAPEPPAAPPDPIYTMKLHESVDVNSYTTALRVHGGWIYEFSDDGFVFVPYHGEAV